MDSSSCHKLSFTFVLSIFISTGAQLPSAAQEASGAASLLTGPQSCGSVKGLPPLLKPGNVLIFGEVHGTQQAPAFVADVVCAAARKRIPTTLGLEIPFEEQEAIDRYLESPGGTATQARLRGSAFWRPELPDGRSSEAMLHLIERARALRAAGAKLRVVASRGHASSRGQEVDRLMAGALAAVAGREPKSLLIVFSGNVHSRLTRATPFDPAYEPMGYLLAKSIGSSRVISLDMSHEGGEAWGCRTPSPDSDELTCAPYPARPQAGAAAWSLSLTAVPGAPFNGTYGVGRITASPPAKGVTR